MKPRRSGPRMSPVRYGAPLLIALFTGAHAGLARADDVDVCAASFESAQRRHQRGDTRAALAEAKTCARDVCPQALRAECSAWVKQWSEEQRVEPPSAAPSKTPDAAATAPAPPPSVTTTRPVPALVYVLGGAFVISIGVSSAFAIRGLSLRSDLEAAYCEPNCATKDVNEARNAFVTADIFAIVGGVALAGALVWYLLRPEASASAP